MLKFGQLGPEPFIYELLELFDLSSEGSFSIKASLAVAVCEGQSPIGVLKGLFRGLATLHRNKPFQKDSL